MTSDYDIPQDEPLFITGLDDAPAMLKAYADAARTMPQFLRYLEKPGPDFRLAKLRFRDPDQSARQGEACFFYLWLGEARYHAAEGFLSAEFFEVPTEIQKWHKPGERLVFSPDDVIDWMILDEGHLRGGYTIRVCRDNLPESERPAYDDYIGVTVYEPLDET